MSRKQLLILYSNLLYNWVNTLWTDSICRIMAQSNPDDDTAKQISEIPSIIPLDLVSMNWKS